MLADVPGVTCPRCGLTFETKAVTNTRCRRCHYVVNIGRRPASPIYRETASASSAPSAGAETSTLLAASEPPGPSAVVVGVALVGAGAFGVWHGWQLGPAEGSDPKALRRVRLRWYVGGGFVAAVGVAVVAVYLRSA